VRPRVGRSQKRRLFPAGRKATAMPKLEAGLDLLASVARGAAAFILCARRTSDDRSRRAGRLGHRLSRRGRTRGSLRTLAPPRGKAAIETTHISLLFQLFRCLLNIQQTFYQIIKFYIYLCLLPFHARFRYMNAPIVFEIEEL
jgi:hypothetical protein